MTGGPLSGCGRASSARDGHWFLIAGASRSGLASRHPAVLGGLAFYAELTRIYLRSRPQLCGGRYVGPRRLKGSGA